jgi:hypothetical protein
MADKDEQPKPGSKEWQEKLNEEIDKHDEEFEKNNPNWDKDHGGK